VAASQEALSHEAASQEAESHEADDHVADDHVALRACTPADASWDEDAAAAGTAATSGMPTSSRTVAKIAQRPPRSQTTGPWFDRR
jgi:hypothetical protein